ncbi:MAG: Multidrug resistance efflux pump [Chthonomonadaceae bacterium]|nr:Multidrug resistance efflux pump [Chthonomonadaceae bacterium]
MKATMLRRAKNRRSALLSLSLLIGCGASGLIWSKTHAKGDPNGKLVTAVVTRGDLFETVAATGSITSQTGTQVKIGSQVTGRIKRLYADVGSQVKAQQIIAELDLPDVRAQLDQASYNLDAAKTKLAQTQSGVSMERTQTSGAVAQAQDQLKSARAKLVSAEAAAKQQAVQTPADIKRAQTALSTAQAALSTAKSNLVQVQADANLQIATAQEQQKQAKANAQNSSVNLKREQALLAKGFVAAGDVDTAQALATVNQSLVDAATQNIELVKQKVTADLQSGQDLVTQAQQGVESAQAALDAAQAEVNTDATKLADVDDARAQVTQAEAGVKIALGNLAQDVLKQQDVLQAIEAMGASREQVVYNKAQVDKTFIRSPISGTVLQLAAQQGETLAAGLSAPTLVVVADLDRLQVDAYVDETDIGKVKFGQKADITVDAFPKKVFQGRVTKIASGSTIQQGVITYDVTIALANPGHQLKPDMTANVILQTGHASNVLLVPSETVRLSGHGGTVAVLLNQDGKRVVQQRAVLTGGTDGVRTEIHAGLKEGDTIVVAGMTQGQVRPAANSPFRAVGGGGGQGR